jgi:hypothetical protein
MSDLTAETAANFFYIDSLEECMVARRKYLFTLVS